jgi:hypothetical protein
MVRTFTGPSGRFLSIRTGGPLPLFKRCSPPCCGTLLCTLRRFRHATTNGMSLPRAVYMRPASWGLRGRHSGFVARSVWVTPFASLATSHHGNRAVWDPPHLHDPGSCSEVPSPSSVDCLRVEKTVWQPAPETLASTTMSSKNSIPKGLSVVSLLMFNQPLLSGTRPDAPTCRLAVRWHT